MWVIICITSATWDTPQQLSQYHTNSPHLSFAFFTPKQRSWPPIATKNHKQESQAVWIILNFHSLMLIVQRMIQDWSSNPTIPDREGLCVCYFCGVLSSQIISLLGFLFLLILRENESEIFPVQEEEKKEKNNLLIFSLVYWNWWWPIAPNKKLNSRFSTYSSSERSDATL